MVSLAMVFIVSIDKELMASALKEQRPYWWCSDIATRPDLQGNGFATALMNIGFQKAS